MCSVTFREKTPEEIIALTCEAGLEGIEWGGDVHVPPTDVANAERVGRLTCKAGLEVSGYGSYYFAFDTPDKQVFDFEPVLNTAIALGAPVIRIWAGAFAIEKTQDYFQRVVEQSCRLASAAEKQGIKIAYEFHENTFSETLDGMLKLLHATDHPNLYAYWQPPNGSNLNQRLEQIAELGKRLLNLHVFHWDYAPRPPYKRRSLAEGIEVWKSCFAAADTPYVERYALLEFVCNDDPKQFLQDAVTLKRWLAKY